MDLEPLVKILYNYRTVMHLLLDPFKVSPVEPRFDVVEEEDELLLELVGNDAEHEATRGSHAHDGQERLVRGARGPVRVRARRGPRAQARTGARTRTGGEGGARDLECGRVVQQVVPQALHLRVRHACHFDQQAHEVAADLHAVGELQRAQELREVQYIFKLM